MHRNRCGFELVSTIGAEYGANDLGVGDFNEDGAPDIAVANEWSDEVSIFLGVGDGSFTFVHLLVPGQQPRRAEIGDINGDGHDDVVVVNSEDNTVVVYSGGGRGSFFRAAEHPVGVQPSGVAPVDLNEDGRDDLVVANQLGNTVSIILSP